MYRSQAGVLNSTASLSSLFRRLLLNILPPVQITVGIAVKMDTQPKIKVATLQPFACVTSPASRGPNRHPPAKAILNKA